MLKSKTILEVQKNDKIFQLHLAPECKYGEVYDVLNEMRDYIVQCINDLNKKQQEENKE